MNMKQMNNESLDALEHNIYNNVVKSVDIISMHAYQSIVKLLKSSHSYEELSYHNNELYKAISILNQAKKIKPNSELSNYSKMQEQAAKRCKEYLDYNIECEKEKIINSYEKEKQKIIQTYEEKIKSISSVNQNMIQDNKSANAHIQNNDIDDFSSETEIIELKTDQDNVSINKAKDFDVVDNSDFVYQKHPNNLNETRNQKVCKHNDRNDLENHHSSTFNKSDLIPLKHDNQKNYIEQKSLHRYDNLDQEFRLFNRNDQTKPVYCSKDVSIATRLFNSFDKTDSIDQIPPKHDGKETNDIPNNVKNIIFKTDSIDRIPPNDYCEETNDDIPNDIKNTVLKSNSIKRNTYYYKLCNNTSTNYIKIPKNEH